MAEQVVVFATIKAKEGCADQVFEILKSLIPPTHAEDGCINYDLHTVLDDPNTFVFHETWQTIAHLDAHMKTTHYLDGTGKLAVLTEYITALKATKQ